MVEVTAIRNQLLKRALLITLLTFSSISCNLTAREEGSFLISSPQTTAQIVLSEQEEQLVYLAAELFAGDVLQVSGMRPQLTSAGTSKYQVKVGTMGANKDFDDECSKAGIDTGSLAGEWETYVIKSIPAGDQGNHFLYVVGSNPRGTAYGLMELSRIIGVSPWSWWADVIPETKASIELPLDMFVKDGPKVKHRGIFLNDEDWGLQPWAAKTFEPETGDIGPKTYGKIFELLLRLKANTIWPAMHPSTKAFYTIPGNKEMAAKYQIFVGTSHAEPMLRNNVGEWAHEQLGEYNYATNGGVVKQYWRERIEQLRKEDKYIVTLGMRGIHDSGMQGHFTKEQRVEMLETIISDQREMLKSVLKEDITAIPQAFVPYKEVLEVYSDGARIPEDVTLVWPDDNHGFIRQLSNTEERKRSGGAGVYYHISYWGRPHDYLWLESVPVSLIWEEMNKAYHTNAKDIWVVNVGDIKPNEIGMNFFLEMAWNPELFSPENLNSYYTRFAAEQFGDTYAEEIGEVLANYFQLGFSRKPEHMGWTGVYPNTPIQDPEFSLFSNGDEAQLRIDAYSKLEEQVATLQNILPERLQDAFYQLVAFKVLGAANMNKKMLYAYKSRVYAQQGRASANLYAEKAREAYDQIQEITATYNQHNDGKWMHMMASDPRELPVFGMPEVGHFEPAQDTAGGIIPEGIAQPVASGKQAFLPIFLSATNRRYFIDVFNAGKAPVKWTAKASDPWVQISSASGETATEERIWVSVDWSRMKGERSQTSSITINVGNSVYQVLVEAQSLKLAGSGQLFVEDNDVISIEAEHFNEVQNTGNRGWKLIQGLGRQNDAVGTFPIAVSPGDIASDAPSLLYEFFTRSAGEKSLLFYCLPSQPINADHKLRFAVSIDNGKPVVIDASLKEEMNEHNDEWSMNVLRAINIAQTKVIIPKTGRHQLKITMMDPGVVLDKIEVVTYGNHNVDSYFGSAETKSRQF